VASHPMIVSGASFSRSSVAEPRNLPRRAVIYSRAMLQRQRHPDFRAAKPLTALVYAALVTMVPVQHALEESVVAVPSIEANHSDDCPRLHAGPACLSAALSLLAMPTVRPRLGVSPLSADRAPEEPVGRLDRSLFLYAYHSRAPPL